MHSVVETPTCLSDAKQAGMDAEERQAIVTFVSVNPQAGDLMAGTGGARKLRFKRPGTGKSSGYRVVFYYGGTTYRCSYSTCSPRATGLIWPRPSATSYGQSSPRWPRPTVRE